MVLARWWPSLTMKASRACLPPQRGDKVKKTRDSKVLFLDVFSISVCEAEVWLFLSPARCEVPCKPGLCIHQLCDTRGQLDIGSVGFSGVKEGWGIPRGSWVCFAFNWTECLESWRTRQHSRTRWTAINSPIQAPQRPVLMSCFRAGNTFRSPHISMEYRPVSWSLRTCRHWYGDFKLNLHEH